MDASRLPPVHVGQRLDVSVESLAGGGEGIARPEGYTLFVPGGLPGDRVAVEVTEAKPRFGRAAIVGILGPSPDRVAAPCPIAERCGGCAWQHLDYAAQLRWKRRLVEEALARIGGLGAVTVRPVLGMAEPWHYRNKAALPLGPEGPGFFARRSHRVIPVEECLIQHPRVNEVLAVAWELAREISIPPYDERGHRGLLRHLVIRVGVRSGEAVLALVLNGEGFAGERAFAAAALERLPYLVGVAVGVNTARTNAIFGPGPLRVVAGRDFVEERLGGLRFEVSARSFFQVNTVQAERLFAEALGMAAGGAPGSLEGARAIDAYCGTGTLALTFARAGARVLGIEAVPDAIADARRNASLNGLEGRTVFQVGRVEEALPQLAAAGGEWSRPDLILLDPPRKGCDPAVLQAIGRMRPRRVVYLSCNPATLARDLAILTADGTWKLGEVQPVDMFPHTDHVECCSSLVSKGSRD